jgi:hypothetical protein
VHKFRDKKLEGAKVGIVIELSIVKPGRERARCMNLKAIIRADQDIRCIYMSIIKSIYKEGRRNVD